MRGKVRNLVQAQFSHFAAFPSDVDGADRCFFYLDSASTGAESVLQFEQSNLDTARTVQRL